jgi:hypothetical protein
MRKYPEIKRVRGRWYMLYPRTYKRIGTLSIPIRRWHRATPLQVRFAKCEVDYWRLCKVLDGGK